MDRLLPTPEQRPDADVVIYDGRCPFCTAQARQLARLDAGERLAFLSLHDEAVRRRWPDLAREQLQQQVYVVDRRGNRHRGAAAVRYLTTRLPALWGLAPLMHIPGSLPVWQWLYQQVARRRNCRGD
jgi:predicted DCC family thiol-disulfide oxidoreductase YuxK